MQRTASFLAGLQCLALASLVGPVLAAEPATATGAGSFTLHSSALRKGVPIAARYTCHGKDASPPLAWSAPPPGTRSLVLVMDDPDAKPVAGYVWDHWLLYDLPAGTRALPEGVPATEHLPDGSRQGENSFELPGYKGPCPPRGQTHVYVFTLYAVDIATPLPQPGSTKAELLKVLQGHTLAQAQLKAPFTAR